MIGIGVGIPHSKGIQRLKYLLDEDFAQGAKAAYALRLLREKHSGGIIRCRADDAGTSKGEADVLPILQPDGSKIITLNSPIENFSGTPFSGDNYVLADLVDAGNNNYDGLTSSWYDQSGNSNDFSNSTASKQPQIVSGGTVITKNNKPAIKTDGNGQQLIGNIPTESLSSFSIFTIFTKIAKSNFANPRVVTFTNSNVDYDNNVPDFISPMQDRDDDEKIGAQTAQSIQHFKITFSQNTQLYGSSVYNGQQIQNNITSINKNETKNDNLSSVPDIDQILLTGRGVNSGGGDFLNGFYNEVIFYFDYRKQEEPDIKSNMNNFYQTF